MTREPDIACAVLKAARRMDETGAAASSFGWWSSEGAGMVSVLAERARKSASGSLIVLLLAKRAHSRIDQAT